MDVLQLFFNADIQRGDLAAVSPDGRAVTFSAGVNAINSLVYASLFTDSRVSDDLADVLQIGEYRGGAWSDIFHTRSPGSLLWTLRREKNYLPTWQKAKDYATAALKHLVDAGYISGYEVQTGFQNMRAMYLRVDLKLPDGSTTSVEYGVDIDGNSNA